MLLINSELLASIDTELEKSIKSNRKIERLYNRIRDGTANFEDAGEFAKEIGSELSKAFRQNISAEVLPDGRLNWNIGNEVVRPEIIKGYDYTSSYFNQVQKAFYKSKKLHINGAQPDLNEDRIKGILDKLSSDEYEKIGWILEDEGYLQNYFESIVDTGIKNNVGLLSQGGMRPTIIRTADAGACKWCRNLAGTYEYPVDDDNVYRRHRDCHCRVTYEIGDFRQDVWSKKVIDNTEDEKRRRFSIVRQVFTPEKAAELEQILLKKQ